MLPERKEKLLQLIIEQYIATAEPIGSQFLVQEASLDLSGATVRNEMRELEEAGYLTHPHTSAGRIPTELGYTYYVEHLMKAQKVKKQIKDQCELFLTIPELAVEDKIKQVGKFLAEYAECAVILSFGKKLIYYTGLTHLFSQPEMRDYAQSIQISVMFDQCEQTMPIVQQLLKEKHHVFIGKTNPLGSYCGTVATAVGPEHVWAFVGPVRMDYGKIVGLTEYIHDLFIHS